MDKDYDIRKNLAKIFIELSLGNNLDNDVDFTCTIYQDYVSKNLLPVMSHIKMRKYLEWNPREDYDYDAFLDEAIEGDINDKLADLVVYVADNVIEIYSLDHYMIRIHMILDYLELQKLIEE